MPNCRMFEFICNRYIIRR